MDINTDVVIVGTGVAGLFSALNLPAEKKIVMITKSDVESSDSFLAQGGICVQRDEDDYESYFEDTMKAGHYENRKESVDIMIRNSRQVMLPAPDPVRDSLPYFLLVLQVPAELLLLLLFPVPQKHLLPWYG